MKMEFPKMKKLTEKNVLEIKTRLKFGESCASISRDFQVIQNTIHNIKMGITWKEKAPSKLQKPSRRLSNAAGIPQAE
jgi:hypothetical protein